MNRLMIAAVIAGGLMLANSPEAAAHPGVLKMHESYAYAFVDVHRSARMPRWLKRNKGFRHWYARTPLKRDPWLGWDQLFEIFHWERRWERAHHRSDRHWRNYHPHRDVERYYDRDQRRPEQRRREPH